MPRDIQAIVEEQIERWRLSALQNSSRRHQELGQPHAVTISSAYGARGDEISRRVGELLGVPVYDRQVIEHIARSDKARGEMFELLGQRGRGRVIDCLEALFRERPVDQQDDFYLLSQTVTSLWQYGPCVLVGHGAGGLVPLAYSVAARLGAAEETRLVCVARREGLDHYGARQLVRQTDIERAHLYRRSFGAEIEDPRQYDLALDTSSLGVEGCARIVGEAFSAKFNGSWRTSETIAPRKTLV